MLQFDALFAFLSQLKLNNNKIWFDQHRDQYQLLRADFVAFIDKLIDELILIDPKLLGQNAKSSVFRINRDVRFSANKNPYKTNMSAYVSQGGKKFPGAGYYFHFEPQASFLAAGIWMPAADITKSVRQEIDYNWEGYQKIVTNKEFHQLFQPMDEGKLVRPPKNYTADNPAIEVLKNKSWVYTAAFKPEGQQADEIVELLSKRVRLLKEYVYFLNQGIDSAEGLD